MNTNYPLRVNPELMEKLKVIATENGRSLNKEIEQLIIRYVREYETDYGEIILQNNQKG